MEKQAKQLKTELLKLTWYMRGGLTYSDVLQMNSRDRDIIGTIVKDNLETTRKSGLPHF
jgi:hypothetical protein